MSAKRNDDSGACNVFHAWRVALVLILVLAFAADGTNARAAEPETAEISGRVVIKGTLADPRYRTIEVNAYNQNTNELAMIGWGSNEFRVEKLPPGLYTLRFDSAIIQEKILRNVKAPTHGLVVELEARAKPRLKIQALDNETSAPVQSYRARVRKVQTLSGLNYIQSFDWVPVDDPQGRAELEVIGPGIYQVEVAANGYAWAWSGEVNSEKDMKKTTVFRLGRGGRLYGRIVNALGQPIAGARVIPMTKTGLRTRGGVSAQDIKDCATTTSERGEFELGRLAAGTERLRVTHRDFCSTNSAAFTITEGRTTTPGADITLRRGGAIAGRVFDEKGKPQPGVTLFIGSYESDLGEDTTWMSGLLATVVTDGQGCYRAEHLPAALCEVMRKEPWTALGVIKRQVLPAEETTRTLNFGGPCRVTGRVLRDGKPWAEARIHIDDEDQCSHQEFWAAGRTGPDGRFSVAGMMPGRRGVYVETNAERAKTVRLATVEVSPREARAAGEIDLGDMQPPDGRVTIEFECADPKVIRNLGGAYVVKDEENGSLLSSWSEGEGTRRDAQAPTVVTGLEPGRYVAIARINTFLAVRQPFTLEPGSKTKTVRLHLPSGGGMLDGFHTIKDAAPLVLCTPDRSVIAEVIVEREHYMIDGLPAGKYQLCKRLSWKLEPVCDVDLIEGEPVSLDITGPEWERRLRYNIGALYVQTMTAIGMPLSGVKVWLERDGKRVAPLPPGRSYACFMVEPPGEYVLKAARPGYRPLARRVAIKSMEELKGKRVEYTRVVMEEEP